MREVGRAGWSESAQINTIGSGFSWPLDRSGRLLPGPGAMYI